ncbi:MAG: hypothetical protein KKE50_05710 [Nanoarchaeota archaeon]|nr:hypothetical protein [Nanoarchaeota archaeon]
MKIVFAPEWFLESDVIIDGFSFLVLLAFFILSYKNYKTSKNKNSLYLGIGFLLIAVAELAMILTKLVLYYDTSFTQSIGKMIVTYHVVNSVDIFYYIGFFFHKFLTLWGLYIIYRIPLKRYIGSDALLAVYFILISSFFGNTFYYIFHLTALVFLVMIISSYLEVYKKNKSKNTKVLIAAFSLLALSQVIFILSTLKVCYAIAQIAQLVSYIILLFLMIRILRPERREQYGRQKKKQN